MIIWVFVRTIRIKIYYRNLTTTPNRSANPRPDSITPLHTTIMPFSWKAIKYSLNFNTCVSAFQLIALSVLSHFSMCYFNFTPTKFDTRQQCDPDITKSQLKHNFRANKMVKLTLMFARNFPHDAFPSTYVRKLLALNEFFIEENPGKYHNWNRFYRFYPVHVERRTSLRTRISVYITSIYVSGSGFVCGCCFCYRCISIRSRSM